jgi:hypothetical protein
MAAPVPEIMDVSLYLGEVRWKIRVSWGLNPNFDYISWSPVFQYDYVTRYLFKSKCLNHYATACPSESALRVLILSTTYLLSH